MFGLYTVNELIESFRLRFFMYFLISMLNRLLVMLYNTNTYTLWLINTFHQNNSVYYYRFSAQLEP